LSDDLLDLSAHSLEGDPEGFECLGGDTLALMNEAEEDVLGADVTVVQQTRFFLGENNDPAGPVCEAFEHAQPFVTVRGSGIGGNVPPFSAGSPLLDIA
jgi:hypothetical protein